jgi:hypothetical protein
MIEVVYDGSYVPLKGVMMSEAYASTLDISFDVRGGLLIRQMHHWAALLFIAAMAVHMFRVFFTGAFRKPREFNWVIGIGLVTLGLGAGFSGYSLPDDLLSGTGLQIARGIVQAIPIIGTIDPHANLSPAMVAATDALIAYRTNPHVDQRDRGIEAARLMARTLAGEIQPTQAAAFPPLAINIECQDPAAFPCLPHYEAAARLRAAYEQSPATGPLPRGTVSIHIRHGDKKKEMTLIPTEKYLRAADDLDGAAHELDGADVLREGRGRGERGEGEGSEQAK